MKYDIFTDRRIAERRIADDVSAEVICRRTHRDRRQHALVKDSWQWWLRVNYVERDYPPSRDPASGDS